MERSNWKDPNNPRRYRIFIPLAVGLVIAAGVIVAINSKVGLTAFGGAPDCQKAGASAKPTPGTPRPGHGRRRFKGGEAVKPGMTPAASPTADAAPPNADQGDAPDANVAKARPIGAPSPQTDMPDAGASAGTQPSAGTGDQDGGAMPSASAPADQPNPSASAGSGMPDPSTSASAGTSADPSTSASADPSTSPSCPPTKQPPANEPNANCTLVVPPNPLTAAGLATPYRLTATDPAMGPCNEANINQSAFVQATILDRATGKVSVYNPLVIDQGSQPAAKPVTPKLPARAVVGIWFGYNADNLTLRDMGGSLRQGRCVNGLNGSVFGQFAYCNAPAFFRAANAAIRRGMLKVPALGTANDGMPCMTTRDFALIDQDQADNVQTQYLATGNGRIAQNTAANKAKLGNATTLANPSDNALLDVFVNPALGCKSWLAPDLADNGAMVPSLALNELQAAADQKAPSALVPLNNPMTLVNDQQSTAKTNLYRAGVNQPPLPAGQQPADYCRQMSTVQTARLKKDMQALSQAASPMPDAANSLFTFLGMRLQGSFGNLGCDKLGMTNPVAKLMMQGDVVVGVTFADGAGNGGNNPPGNGNGDNPGDGNGTADPSAMPSSSAPGATPPTHRPPHRRHGPPPQN